MRKQTPIPPQRIDPGAVAHDQQRDAPDGIERGRGPSDRELRLPHERDESPRKVIDRDVAPYGPTGVIEQAAQDVERGLVDTERRGTPSDVPTPRRRARNRKPL
jgi:hypothetical protein